MMYQSKEDFLNVYRQEGNLTLACLKELTDESLEQAVSDKDRTLGEIAWHITTSVGGFGKLAGLNFDGPQFDSEQPATAKEIQEAYQQVFESTLKAYEESLTDENFKENGEFFGRQMPKNEFLYTFIIHQTHHRGQMTVLMRQADLRVPSIYGPSRDAE